MITKIADVWNCTKQIMFTRPISDHGIFHMNIV